MLNRSASLAISTSVLKALPGKLDIKRHSHASILLNLLNKLQKRDEMLGKPCIYLFSLNLLNKFSKT